MRVQGVFLSGSNPHSTLGYAWELRKKDEKVLGPPPPSKFAAPGRRSPALDCQPVTHLNHG
jgi:hypothetical protein